MYECKECSSKTVLQKAWVNINTGEIQEYIDVGDNNEYWCEDCQEHIRPVYVGDE